MRIKVKLLLGYVLIVLLIVIVAGTAIYGFNDMKDRYQSIIMSDKAIVIQLREIQFYFTGQANDERGFLITAGAEFRQEITEKSQQVKMRIDAIRALGVTQKESELLDRIDKAHAKFTQVNFAVMDLYSQGKLEEAKQLSFGDGRTTRKELEGSFNELVRMKEASVNANMESADRHAGVLIAVIFSVAAGAVIAGSVTGLVLARRITRPINVLNEEISKLAQDGGDLTQTIHVTSTDEIGGLASAVNRFLADLRGIVAQVLSCSGSIATSTRQLSAGAGESAQASNQVAETIAQVAAGAEHQVDMVNCTSTVVEKLSSAVRQAAVNADKIVLAAEKSADAAQNGGQAVSQAIDQMSIINETVANSAEVAARLGGRSQEIGLIVNTISGLAGQTNLLALNAAIEAARAGEQGRGFAVVAEEVRKLAEQSQNAAKHIAELISDIQGDTDKAVAAMNEGTRVVQKGTEVVNRAGDAFNQIVEHIDQVLQQTGDISGATRQIAAGSQEIVVSVHQIQQVCKDTAAQTQTVSAATEEQSAAAEEIAAASQAMNKQVDDLTRAVGKFKV